jgi:chromosome segregation ATPase
MMLILTACLGSCADERSASVERYRTLLCSEVRLQQQDDSLLHREEAISTQLYGIGRRLDSIGDRYDGPLASLQDDLMAEEQDYDTRYNALARRHEAQHGHLMTPEYQRAIAALDAERERKKSALQSKIDELEKERDVDRTLRNLSGQKIAVQEELAAIKQERGGITANRSGLRRQADSLEALLSTYEKGLDKQQREQLDQERRQWRQSPCVPAQRNK